MSTLARHRYTWQDYVAFESGSNTKHEFFEGEIFAMAGGTPQHARLTAELTRDLGNQLRGKPWVPYSADLRVRVTATGLATYPDVTVICGPLELDPHDRHTATNPAVVVEVTSPSTEAYDRGEKLRQFQLIPSLREVVLVSHREHLIEVFRRDDSGWARTEARTGAQARLESIGCTLSVDSLYDGVAVE